MDYNPKLLPGNIEAEASLLGCLLINGKLFGTVEGTGLSSQDFYEERHSVIFKIIQSIHNEGKIADAVTVGDRISTVKGGGAGVEMKYLYELANTAPVVSESILEDYCRIIIDKSLYRELIRICSESVDSAYRQSAPFVEVVDKSTTDLIALSNRHQAGSVIEIKTIVDAEMQKLKERIDSGRKISGISSGYPVLDNFGSGFKPGDMIVLAGRPGMGKTSFALNMTIEIARLGHNVLFFSLEMPSSQLVQRIISIECSVNAKNLAIGKFEKDEITRLWAGVDKVSKLPIFIDETSKLTVSDLRSKAKKLDAELRKSPPSTVRSNRLDCIFVDYLQLMASNVYREDKVRQVEDISRNIKLFAKELGIPIIALAQLNRKVEERKESKIPMLSDLKDSGAIEQDADLVMFIHREEVYKKDTEKKNIADIFIQKNRHGQQGSVHLRFVPQYTKFATMDPSEFSK
ncbi:MAG TPA: replicative DNA helicase [bacterium]|nr:replicative DNA helicase [bacterium]